MNRTEVKKPTYDPVTVTPGIAHFGVGNFHRSHQAMYLDRLMSNGTAHDWGIIGIGVMPGDIHMRDALAQQGFRYTLVEKSGDGSVSAREISSIIGMLYAPENPRAVMAQLADPAIRIISLTITEGGYNIDRTTGIFDTDNPVIQHDIANPHNPMTVFGYITEALRLRRASGTPPFTIMSCDNLPANGDVAKHAILTFATEIDPALAMWIQDNVWFPNAMVDRITPVTTDSDRQLVKNVFGIDDAWPVVTEPFTQWVLEDNFCNGRPPFELVGVQMTDDVAPYELMKLRLLNAGHQAMAYIGLLRGYTYVHEAVDDSDIERFLRAYLEEARQTLLPVQGINVDAYIATLFERFSNPYIADTLARLAVDASDRVPKFVLPALRDNLAASKNIEMGAAVIASWAQYLATNPKKVVDSMADELLLRSRSDNPLEFVVYVPVFGDLGENPHFAEVYMAQAESLRTALPSGWLKKILEHAV